MDKRLLVLVFVAINAGVLECTVCTKDSCSKNVTCGTDKPFTQCTSFDGKNNCSFICVSKCLHNQVLDGSKCINVTECKKPIVFQHKCLDLCPVGYVFSYDVTVSSYDISHTVSDLDDRYCVSRRSLQLTVAGFAVATVAYILFLCAFFSLRSFSLSSMKKFFLSLRQCKKKNTDLESDDSDSDEELICTAGNQVHDDDDENMLL